MIENLMEFLRRDETKLALAAVFLMVVVPALSLIFGWFGTLKRWDKDDKPWQ